VKFAAGLLIFAALASAADKRYAVCLVSGSTAQCTKPLTRETSEAVYAVFVAAPIGNLDAVYIEDVKTKKMVKGAKAEPEPDEPGGEPLHGAGDVKL
jgi:hypothetical protein